MTLCNTEGATVKGRQNYGPQAKIKISVDLCMQEVSSSPVPCPNSDPHWEDAHPAFVSPTAWADPALPVLCPRVRYDPLPTPPTRAVAVTAAWYNMAHAAGAPCGRWGVRELLCTASAAAASVSPYSPSRRCWVPTENKGELQPARREESLESYTRGDVDGSD